MQTQDRRVTVPPDGPYTIADVQHSMRALKTIAHRLLSGMHSPSLQASDLVQEALLREPDKIWQDEQHFLNDTRNKMKQALIDYLRRKNAARRQAPENEISEARGLFDQTPSTVYGLNQLQAALQSLQFTLFNNLQTPDITQLAQDCPEAMEAFLNTLRDLEARRPDWAQVVELRVFAGLTFEQIAALIGKSEKTVRTHWSLARGVLQSEDTE